MAKRKIVWSSRAKIDQFNILDYYYKRNQNKAYSQKLHSKFRSAVKLLAKFPEIGTQTDIKNVRSLAVENHTIFYRINKDIIEIITIWDDRQDPERLKIE